MGAADVAVGAGTFTALELVNDYRISDWEVGGMSLGEREGTVTTTYVEGLGLVYSEDVLADLTVFETRELVSYGGFYPWGAP